MAWHTVEIDKSEWAYLYPKYTILTVAVFESKPFFMLLLST